VTYNQGKPVVNSSRGEPREVGPLVLI